MTLGRCNYCPRPATVRMSWMGYLSTRRRKWSRVSARACPEHEGCPNWMGLMKAHPDARMEREEPRP